MRTIPFLFTTKLRDVNAQYFLHTHATSNVATMSSSQKRQFQVARDTEPKQFVSAVRLTFDLYGKNSSMVNLPFRSVVICNSLIFLAFFGGISMLGCDEIVNLV